MADLTEMCHTVRSRTRTAIAKVSTDACRGLGVPLSIVNISFVSRSENIRDPLLATDTSGLMTGKKKIYK